MGHEYRTRLTGAMNFTAPRSCSIPHDSSTPRAFSVGRSVTGRSKLRETGIPFTSRLHAGVEFRTEIGEFRTCPHELIFIGDLADCNLFHMYLV